MSAIQADKSVDTSGRCCPAPIVETNRAIKQMSPGQVLELISTDLGSRMDNSAGSGVGQRSLATLAHGAKRWGRTPWMG